MHADRQGQPAPVRYRHDLHAFAGFRLPDVRSASLGPREGGVDEGLRPVDPAGLAEFARQIPQGVLQHAGAAPLLEAPVRGLVVGVALGHHMPLGPGLQDPQDPLEDLPGRNRRPPAPLSRALLGKVVADPIPLVVRELEHKVNLQSDHSQRKVTGIFEIASRNALRRGIPSQLGHLSNLRGLGLRFNRLDGLVPPELGKLSRLTFLSLADNDLAGPLPLSFAALAEIEIFYFDNTRLCVTADEALGAWLDAIPYHIGTGAGCAERVANHPSNDVRPTTSADRRIAFNSDRDGNWEIYSMRANGTGVTRWPDEPSRRRQSPRVVYSRRPRDSFSLQPRRRLRDIQDRGSRFF